MKTLLDHPLFFAIKEEHQLIQAMASQLKVSIEENLHLLVEALHKHHRKEEMLLFAALNTKPQISEGGPMCTYFFDAQITSPPLATAEQLTRRTPEIPQELNFLWIHKSPLRIPTSEHLALQHILKYSDFEHLKKNLSLFLEIITSNIRKEEDCLFHVCCRLLNKDELDRIHQSWSNEM